MRFKRKSSDDMPDINLVPMMDVLMTVLTFFILVSMTLTGQQIANVALPKTDGSGIAANENKPLLAVGLNVQNQIVLEDKIISAEQLAKAMQEFYTKHSDGTVLLKADRQLDYSKVVQLLKTMREIGGDQVSLAIARQEAGAK